MKRDQLLRLGIGVLAVGLAAFLVATRVLPLDPLSEQFAAVARKVAIGGTAVLALGLVVALLERTGIGGRRCPRCGKPASAGSVFCTAHRQELARAAREARDHHDPMNRPW